jgi:hypothetical protein
MKTLRTLRMWTDSGAMCVSRRDAGSPSTTLHKVAP